MGKTYKAEEEYKTRDGKIAKVKSIKPMESLPLEILIDITGEGNFASFQLTADGLMPGSNNDHPFDIVEGKVEYEGKFVICANRGDMIPTAGIYSPDKSVLVMGKDGQMVKAHFDFIGFFDEAADPTLEAFTQFVQKRK